MFENTKWYAKRKGERAWGIVSGSLDSKTWVIDPTHKLTAIDAALMCATHNARLANDRSLMLESIVAHESGEPRIQLTLGEKVAQFSVADARNLIRELHETTEAAITDAFIAAFLRRDVFAGSADADQQVGMMLSRLREFRDELEGKGVQEVGGAEGEEARAS